jgi:hypothetical protein
MKLDGKLINTHGSNKVRHINCIQIEHQGLSKKQLNKLKKYIYISIAVSSGIKKKLKGI